jgi:hypothetical protein
VETAWKWAKEELDNEEADYRRDVLDYIKLTEQFNAGLSSKLAKSYGGKELEGLAAQLLGDLISKKIKTEDLNPYRSSSLLSEQDVITTKRFSPLGRAQYLRVLRVIKICYHLIWREFVGKVVVKEREADVTQNVYLNFHELTSSELLTETLLTVIGSQISSRRKANEVAIIAMGAPQKKAKK